MSQPKVTLLYQSKTLARITLGFRVLLFAQSEWWQVARSTSQRPPHEWL